MNEKKFMEMLLNHPLYKKLREFDLDNIPLGDDTDSVGIIADDYFHLLKAVYKKKKPYDVAISRDGCFTLTVGGEEVDFDLLIRHNDLKNTERVMEIESLFADGASVDEVEALLRGKIEEEW